jgi:hypothetical protein
MKRLLTLLYSLIALVGSAQVINGYAEVTGIAGSVLTLGTVDEGGNTFEDDEWVVIMQMQDDVIGVTGNNVNFGDMGDIENAGIYEIRQIQSHTETAGVPTTITLQNNPNYTYNFGANSLVQIITLTQLGAPDYTTTGNMSAKDWDGTTGGVLAIYTPGILTLNHSLSADFNGFRGAGPNAGGSAGCSGGGSYRVNTQNNFADKGEGIFRRTANNQRAGMGKILNGGGGGNSHNGGGGGGGNYTSGGDAGPGWPTCNPSAGGLGGISLQADISVGRIFMGGGGGAGEGNNNLSTDGGDGGGIILLKAEEVTTDACAGVTISANGESIAFAGNDGGGGGGAGGSIVLEVNTWNITGGCPLIVESNGGDGGDVNSGATHGGGGGGGQGVVFYSSTTPTTNVTTNTNNGAGGCDNNSSPCNSQAGSGGGVDGDGVQDMLTGPLPIELLKFEGYLNNDHVDLFWTTMSETDNDYFSVEHSINGIEWNRVAKVDGAGNSNQELQYSAAHDEPNLGVNYYRLRQTDFNGTYTYTDPISILFEEDHLVIYPNPANTELNIYKPGIGNFVLTVYNSLGQEVNLELDAYEDMMQVDVERLENGVYFGVLRKGEHIEYIRFSVDHF